VKRVGVRDINVIYVEVKDFKVKCVEGYKCDIR
jgi:hypothetical protein